LATDEQLLVDYLAGDQLAFEELVKRYQTELYAFLHRFVSDAATAEDLFQETFIQVHRNARTFDATRKFRPWLFTIAANKARDFLRSSNRRNTQSLDNTTGTGGASTFLDLMQADQLLPADELAKTEDVQQVQAVLAEMPAMYREVLILNYFHRFAYKQMADMLGVPLGTVKSRLHASIAHFAKAWTARERAKEHHGK
jgi:RNA polymerase sigma-70 factor (ECF subfamily)